MYLREDGTPYYIGKGSKRRAWSTVRIVNKPYDPARIKIFLDDLDEQDALNLEEVLIAQYGRKDNGTGILRNLTEGGDGVSGYKYTPQQKAENKRRVIKSVGKPCVCVGHRYESVIAAARALGITTKAIRHRIASPNFPDHNYETPTKDDELRSDAGAQRKINRVAQYKPVMISGIEYESINCAAKSIGVSVTLVYNRIRNDLWPEYKYLNPTKSDKARIKKFQQDRIGRPIQKPITIDGIKYCSFHEAGRKLGITREQLRKNLVYNHDSF